MLIKKYTIKNIVKDRYNKKISDKAIDVVEEKLLEIIEKTIDVSSQFNRKTVLEEDVKAVRIGI